MTPEQLVGRFRLNTRGDLYEPTVLSPGDVAMLDQHRPQYSKLAFLRDPKTAPGMHLYVWDGTGFQREETFLMNRPYPHHDAFELFCDRLARLHGLRTREMDVTQYAEYIRSGTMPVGAPSPEGGPQRSLIYLMVS